MKQIISAHDTNLKIFGKMKSSDLGYRLTKYCVTRQVDDGVLLFHVLTRELLFLTKQEYATVMNNAYLREHWFVVPQELDEKKYADLVRLVRSGLRKNNKNITKYTILTTTECNARCFYCYERGYAKKTMDEATAKKVIAFIKKHHGGEDVKLLWFGGEPLVNVRAIETICEGLKAEGINFQSTMVSNGYLFQDELVMKAKRQWNLKKVQITLDGTEEVYNRSKAYIYRKGSAYQIVISNIIRLLEEGIAVQVRLNMGPANAENLFSLVDELAERFANQSRLKIYTRLIFDSDKPQDQWYTEEEWTYLYASLEAINDKIAEYGMGLGAKKNLKKDISINQCMADSGNSVVVVPDGHLGLCEHFAESEFFGHLDSEEWDMSVIASWKERCDEIPECRDCFYYPTCIRLKKCPNHTVCSENERTRIRRIIERAMVNEYMQAQDKKNC